VLVDVDVIVLVDVLVLMAVIGLFLNVWRPLNNSER